MATSFTITGAEKLTLMLEWLDPKVYRGAIWSGLKIAGRGGRTLAAKEVGQRFNLAAARIKQDISDPKLNLNTMSIEYRISQEPISSGSYGYRDTGKGLRGSVTRGGARTPIVRGFQLRKERGTNAKGWQRSGNPRLPMHIVWGPSIGRIILGPQSTFGDQIVGRILERTQEQFVKGVDSYLTRKGRG
jgi:hypothetical protein